RCRRLHVVRLRQRHRLHDDRRPTADRDPADADLRKTAHLPVKCRDMPFEPPPTTWALPRPPDEHPVDAFALGADLAPGPLLAAYRAGLFPRGSAGRLVWWSPARRAVLPVAGYTPSRSLRRAGRGFAIRMDTAFAEVIRGCADPSRPH